MSMKVGGLAVIAGSIDGRTRREQLTRLAERKVAKGNTIAPKTLDDLQSPLEKAARRAGVTAAEVRQAAAHSHDPEGFLISLILVAEGEAARQREHPEFHAAPFVRQPRLSRLDLIALGTKDWNLLVGRARAAGVSNKQSAGACDF